MEITVDFNRPGGQYHANAEIENSFSNFISVIIVDNLRCNLFHSVMYVQQS